MGDAHMNRKAGTDGNGARATVRRPRLGGWQMNNTLGRLVALFAVVGLVMAAQARDASAADESNVQVTMTALEGWISAPDGADLYMWSFTDNGTFRYPGSPIDVDAGDVVRVRLINDLPDLNGDGLADPVSMVFTGMDDVKSCRLPADCSDSLNYLPVLPAYETANSEREGLRSFAPEATNTNGVSADVWYEFTADRPGTYQYYSGTFPQKHIDMGLGGALVVRPSAANQAYGVSGTGYDNEFLQVYTEVDPTQHARVARGQDYRNSIFRPEYWFINGRSFPDTIAPDNVGYLPSQPDGALILLNANEHVLMRLVTLGRDLHPMHHHGNSAMVVGLDGEPMSADGLVADLAVERYTPVVNPGETVDTIFTWTKLDPADFGWDTEGALDGSGNVANPVPVPVLPTMDNPNEFLAYGETYSGSPYLGKKGALNPADEAINVNVAGEYYVPFHSHHEIELQNQGEGPGGMLTLIAVFPPLP